MNISKLESKKPLRVSKNSGSLTRKESWPLSVFISAKATLAPDAFKAITISLLFFFGYNQSEEKDIIKNLVLLF